MAFQALFFHHKDHEDHKGALRAQACESCCIFRMVLRKRGKTVRSGLTDRRFLNFYNKMQEGRG
jgi:hypothetical protein